ncbi:MAG: hypothetical protein HWN81_03420 [Candidatus Lokiarchaeota archaeon]|nr:hypothetical protein [Candidatus Lokiarchaeota archaeon]
MKKLKLKLTAVAVISILLLSGYTPFLDSVINDLNSNPKQNNIIDIDNLYLDEVTETLYLFSAQGACYLLVEIEGTDFTYFMLDEEIYVVSYGLNIFPIEFSTDLFKIYRIKIDPSNLQYFKSITVEPLFIAEDEIEVNLNQDTEISFKAGGPISILTRPTFAYNWLYVELQNETGGSTLLKRIHDTAEYPEIDPLFYCMFIERGTYIRYDINLEPGEYRLLLKGDGLLEYKIIVNLDWDEDLLDDVDEVQQEGLYDFELDPTYADIWGFYEKSSDNQIFMRIDETNYTEGLFTFYIPELYPNAQLALRVNSGEFKEIAIDGNYTFFEDKVFISDLESPPDYEIYGSLEPGWHSISYLYIANFTADIEFLANYEEIKILMFPELLDSDGDGFKDFAETTSGLNPSKIDTDEDELPDNYDSSPLAKLELDPLKINQIIIPTNSENNTIINIHVKKPINDYSTYGVPRYWHNVFNVSIYPVLRLFGNKFNDDDGTKKDMNRVKLIELWGKDVSLLFKSDENFDETQIGDPLPAPDDPDNEYYFVFPKSAESNFEYDIIFPNDHDSKDDGFLDLRFDFIWLITKYDYTTKDTSLLHLYDFEENIIIQSMAIREFSNIDYILGSPDSFIENQILWTLTQNPSLGTPEEYNVEDDIIGNGTIDYFNLPDRLIQDKINSEEEIDQTEVLYITGLYQNYDILNKIAIQEMNNPPFEIVHNGDFEAFFSYYTISDVYQDQNYTFGDLEVQGESKILYQTYYANLSVDSNTNIQKRASIMGIPISMNVFKNLGVLKIKQAQGTNIPLEEIPLIFNSQLSENINILEQTYIEQNDQVQGTPLLNFEVGVDIYKEFIDNRQDTVVLSDLFFNDQPYMPAESFLNFISNYWDQVNTLNDQLNLLREIFLSSSNNEIYVELIDNLISDVNILTQQHSYSDLSNYLSFFSNGLDLKSDFIELLEPNLVKSFFTVVSPSVMGDIGELVAKTSEAIADQLAEKGPKIPKLNQHKQNNNKMGNSIKSQARMSKFTTVSGATCAVLGIAMMVFTFVEIFHLIGQKLSGEYDNKSALFAMRLCSAFCTMALGAIVLVKGIILMSMRSVKEATVASLKTAGKVLGAIGIVLSILIVVFDWVSFAIKWQAGDIYDMKGALFDMVANTVIAAVGIILCLFASGIGAAFGIIAGGLLILGSWLSSKINNPSIDIKEENCKIILPAETLLNMRRHGGLEVGDQIKFRFHVVEDGDTVVYMHARFRLYGAGGTWWTDWDGWHGEWNGYCHTLDHTFSRTIEDITPDVGYQLQFQMDWQKFTWYIFWFSFSREFGCDELISEHLGMPALENSISDFYANTHEVSSLIFKQLFEKAISEYKYKDAFIAAGNVIKATEEYAGIGKSYFNALYSRLDWNSYFLNFNYFVLQTTSNWEYTSLLTSFISEGVIPLFFFYYPGWAALASYSAEELQALLSYALQVYSASSGILLIPVDWVTTKNAILVDVDLYAILSMSLPFWANWRVDGGDNELLVDPATGIGEASLKFQVDPYFSWLIGPDPNKQVTYILIAPEGFSTLNAIVGTFPRTLDFTIIRYDQSLLGAFQFELQMFIGASLIYKDTIPLYIENLYKVELITQSAEDPIVPGQDFSAVYVNNTGTSAVMINVSVEGIPGSFINKELYPNIYHDGELVSGYVGDTLVIGLNPGEVIEVFTIHPPRHYTTLPGPYTYTVHVKDHIYGNFDHHFTDTFIVDDFYDMDFQCLNPDITIYDYETASYTFNLTNLGNVDQEFDISIDHIPFAEKSLSMDTIYLEPGDFQEFTLTLTPIGWGELSFIVNASSDENSSIVIPKIQILDDDIHPPDIILEIIDTPTSITINFEVTNEDEGDDYGLSNISIYIDDNLILNCTPDPTETYFSFTFDDTYKWYGGWFIEHGIHDISIRLVDNDFDVPNDANTSLFLGAFETTFDDMREYVKWKIDNLNQMLQESSNDYWRHPDNNLKAHIGQKLTLAKQMIDTDVFLDAYNKMLHDIKPKITGLKTDENEQVWGNGVFNNPWVIEEELSNECKIQCNTILSYILILNSLI